MKYGLFIYEDETLYGPDKAGPRIQEIVGKRMAFNRELGPKRLGGGRVNAASWNASSSGVVWMFGGTGWPATCCVQSTLGDMWTYTQ